MAKQVSNKVCGFEQKRTPSGHRVCVQPRKKRSKLGPPPRAENRPLSSWLGQCTLGTSWRHRAKHVIDGSRLSSYLVDCGEAAWADKRPALAFQAKCCYVSSWFFLTFPLGLGFPEL